MGFIPLSGQYTAVEEAKLRRVAFFQSIIEIIWFSFR